MTSAEPQPAEVLRIVIPPSVEINEHDTLKYHLLGPSLTKAGQDSVDQQKASPSKNLSRFKQTLMAMAGIRGYLQCL